VPGAFRASNSKKCESSRSLGQAHLVEGRGDTGAEGNPVLALKRSLDIGTQTNSSGQRVNYIEICEPDVLADDLQPILRDGAALFK
jgi:hypothetical protein